jgi:3-phenylpropionate/trans-cinnamate dioxygenase ferredoxin reductase subunit
MPHYPYLIVGGGMTGDAAVQGIREVDAQAAIGLIGADPHPPYNRPPLSKALWKGEPLASVWRKADRHGVDLHLGRNAVALDAAQRRITDDQGTVYTWDRLLLATGGAPRRLPFGGESIIYFRTLDDYTRLRALTEHGQRFAVIGGGFIGSEIAAALAMNHKDVVMLFPEAGVGARVYPEDLSRFLNAFYREKGVDVRPGETVTGLDPQPNGRVALLTQGGERHMVDGVVAGIGITPNVGLAQAAGLSVDNGIIVDERLQTTHPGIYAAGDVAAFRNPALGRRVRVEHEDNANTMGKAAGRAMAGAGESYTHLPFFYSDLFELGYEAIGNLDSRLETVADWKDRHREGVVYYLQDGRVCGVLLWNTWGQVDAARRLIAERGPFRREDLAGRLPAAS